jgi:hypothetical protein
MQNVLKSMAVLFVLLNLAGCASAGMVQNAGPITASKPFALDFILVETTSSLGGLDAEKSKLNDLIVSGLRERQLFKGVSGNKADAGSDSGIKIDADIKAIKQISKNRRSWLGALAGHARILVQVTISDLNAGNQMETFEVEGQSTGGSDLAGTTDEAMEVAAGEVVAQVVAFNAQTAQ